MSLDAKSEKGRWNDRVTIGDKESMCGRKRPLVSSMSLEETECIQGPVLVELECMRVRKGRATGTAIILCPDSSTKPKSDVSAANEGVLRGRPGILQRSFDMGREW